MILSRWDNRVGRAVLCPPPLANQRVLIHADGAHGVTRPTNPKIIQNNLSTFATGGDELLMTQTQHFMVFKGFPFVFNVFAGFGGVVAAGKTIVSAVKTSQRTAKTTPASAGEVVAAGAGTSPTAKTTRLAAETISSAVAKVVAVFQTSRRTVQIISRTAKIISTTVNAV
jgi:hypothetical protein